MHLHFLRKGKLVEDQTVLSDLGVQGGQIVQLEIESADLINKLLKYTRVSPTYNLPDKVNVKVEIGNLFYCSMLAPFALSKLNYSADSVPSFLIHHRQYYYQRTPNPLYFCCFRDLPGNRSSITSTHKM